MAKVVSTTTRLSPSQRMTHHVRPSYRSRNGTCTNTRIRHGQKWGNIPKAPFQMLGRNGHYLHSNGSRIRRPWRRESTTGQIQQTVSTTIGKLQKTGQRAPTRIRHFNAGTHRPIRNDSELHARMRLYSHRCGQIRMVPTIRYGSHLCICQNTLSNRTNKWHTGMGQHGSSL